MILDNKNIKSLDGLRGYSILLVLISHIGFGHLFPGGLGVTIFFFVSGFLICKLLLFELSHEGRLNYSAFYLRRVFRLYPALIFFIFCALILFVIFNRTIDVKELFASFFYYMNYYMVYFRKEGVDSLHGIFNILWSLSIEEHFYLIFPFMLTITYKNNVRFILFSGAILVICLMFRLYYGYTLNGLVEYENYNYHLTHTRMDSIMYGCLVAFLLHNKEDVSEKTFKFLTNNYVIIISIILLAFSLLYRNEFFRETFRYTVQGVALSCLIVNIIYNKIPAISFLFNGKIIVLIGRLSYSLYLFHWVSIMAASLICPQFTSRWYLIVIPSTIVLSLFSYYLVEMPFVGLRKKFGSNAS